MKMKSLCLAMALVGLTSHYAAAADGTLNFIGKIVNSVANWKVPIRTVSLKLRWALFRCLN
ncbi:type 1 fimbriae major subunit FimA [Klebsiella pneumoniae]|nr:type 1 fimbriae major subunit FimA [Klebsiella pneumoniae]SYP87092.1 type 1 fimbriae major subunit FimA [Klebsiella pneumoniae]